MHNRTIISLKKLINNLLKTPFRPRTYTVNGVEIPLMRLEIPVKLKISLAWLETQNLFPKIYWENPKENMKVAAIGKALQLNSIPYISNESGPRFFGGQDFMNRRYTNWETFPSCSYILPLIELEERNGMTFLNINRTNANLSLDLEDEKPLLNIPSPISRLDTPSFSVWEQNILQILDLISQNKITKIVPARCTCFDFKNRISPYTILQCLQEHSPTTTLFSFQFNKDQTFFGATPETLYRKKGGRIETEAIAGTRPIGKTLIENRKLVNELLKNKKEIHEFNVVKETIEQTLSPLCEYLVGGGQKIIKTLTVQHLYHRFQGKLREKITDDDLLKSLHPTPAVGGLDRKKAIDEIKKREYFDRGWFAAPVGWITKDESHHVVGIRSALAEKTNLYLFAGAGIVKGSIPHIEWNELEHKISQYLLWDNQ